jgi:hypothetical protein
VPLEPKTRGTLTGAHPLALHFEWLRPVLRWQAFPRDADFEAAPEEMRRVRNVRYDLVIAREQNMAPDQIVYRRDGLTGTVHRIETTLKSDTRYFWTVRARFNLDGRERVTERGATSHPLHGNLTSPSSWSYRFKTQGWCGKS